MSISSALSDISKAARTLFGSSLVPDKPGRINQFTSLVNMHGVSYEHMFVVTIYHKTAYSDVQELVSYFCMGAQIPALNLLTATYRENHAHYELPYGISYEPVNLVFIGDKNLVIKNFFDAWYRSMYDNLTNRLAFPDEYRVDVKIQILDKVNATVGAIEDVYSVTLKNAYPKSIGNINLGHQNTNVVSFPVQFVYEKLELTKTDLTSLFSQIELDQLIFANTPARPNSFPFNVIEDVKGVASELMAGVMKEVESFGGSVADIGRGVANTANVVSDALRTNVQVPIYDRSIPYRE